MQKYEEQFHQPQMFVRMGRSIMAIPVPDDMVKKMEEKAAKPQENYVGNGMMIHCGSPISYASIETSYWRQHYYCMGRIR